jgi:predicted adenylyl cyclase CyaB
LSVDDPAALRALLTGCLGERGQVRKNREIWFWHNVRIHLDEVADLGTFIEFEAVLSPIDDESTSQTRLDRLCEVLSIDPSAAFAAAYADLLGF